METVEYYLPGQVVDYARKSFAQAKERHAKSIEDQFAACAEVREENGFQPTGTGELFEESQNHGGDEWWRAHPERGLDAMHSDRTRPVLTDLMLGVVEGRIRVIVCWSTDRIHRDVGIAQAFINLLIKHKVRLFDRTGEVPLNHPDAEAAYLNAAVAAQHFRKQCAVNSPRGIKRSARKGIVVTDANVLGFRSGGRFSKIVEHRPTEQDKVNELYDWCIQGMTYDQISNRLMAEGYEWTPDLHDKRAVKRNEFTKDVIYPQQIKTVLTDPRYVGKQKQFKQLWDCAAYLADGVRTVVPVEKWEAVQEIIASRSKGGNHVNRTRSLTGLLRCCLCAQCLRVSQAGVSSIDGTKGYYWVGIKGNRKPGYWCTDSLPTISETLLDDFLASVLCPLLLAEAQDKMALQTNDTVAADRVMILRQLAETEHYWEHVLPTFDTPDITPASYSRKEKACLKKIEDLRLRLRDAEAKFQSLDQVALSLGQYTSLPPQQQRDILHSVIRWVAIIPRWALPDFPENPRRKKRPCFLESRLVVLTAFGTYTTMVVTRQGRRHALRLAAPDEVVASVACFPDPEGYLRGIERQFQGGHYGYSPDAVCPGYIRTQSCSPVAEFEAEFFREDDDAGSIPTRHSG